MKAYSCFEISQHNCSRLFLDLHIRSLSPQETGEQLPYSFSTKQSTTTASAKFQLKKFFQFSGPDYNTIDRTYLGPYPGEHISCVFLEFTQFYSIHIAIFESVLFGLS